MRLAIGFLIVAGLWLAVSNLPSGTDSFDEIERFLFAHGQDRNAPNWGDVAAKIGELSDERAGLEQNLDPPLEAPEQ